MGENGEEELSKNVPDCVYQMREALKKYIELSKMVS